MGYDVITVEDGSKAQEIFQKKHNDIDLVIVDLCMPKINGPDTYSSLSKIKNDLPVIFVTGFDTRDLAVKQKVRLKNSMRVLQKPYELKKLQQNIHELLHM